MTGIQLILVIGSLIMCLVSVAVSVTLVSPVPGDPAEIPVCTAEVLKTYPHDPSAFTQGLAYSEGILIEGTGLAGRSGVRQVNLVTGEVLNVRNLSGNDFGEGVTVLGDRIFQLTEDSHICYSYDRDSLTPGGNFTYPTAGWGLTNDGEFLIMSDGTDRIYFLDPITFSRVRELRVHAGTTPVWSLNELEYIRGEIYANIWPTKRIAIISPVTGEVTGWIDLSGLLSEDEQDAIDFSAIGEAIGNTSLPLRDQACPNGIAYDPENGRLFVTGKLWPYIYEIRLVSPKRITADEE